MRLKTLCAISAIALMALGIGCQQPCAENGAALYRKHCARCHIPQEGQSSPAPVLTGYFSRNPAPALRDVRAVIRDGERAMPPFGKRLSSREIDDVITYMKTLR